jgi:hypothetical protein
MKKTYMKKQGNMTPLEEYNSRNRMSREYRLNEN